jgi:hypothetical protein
MTWIVLGKVSQYTVLCIAGYDEPDFNVRARTRHFERYGRAVQYLVYLLVIVKKPNFQWHVSWFSNAINPQRADVRNFTVEEQDSW